ncbi:MAG: DUF255 domain-containing protein [Nanoarchaeota archaeon]
MNTKIKWLDWNKSAFEKSKTEKKPVLLGISAVWCHWCHNMDNLAYSDKSVIEFINNNYIPIRVDTDKRPDVNESYNVGGWPTTAILSSEGELLNGATYLPIEDMLPFLRNGIDLFIQKRESAIHEEVKPIIPEKLSSPNDFMNLVIDSFSDSVNGGFGLEPKFPHFEILEYLFTQPKYKDMLLKTLNSMANSDLQDVEAGGFYRYATQQNWSIPHYEKMLEDNAKHLLIYLNAYELTKESKYKNVSENIIRFLLSVLFDEQNIAFYGSQDADEAYCFLSLKEREKSNPPYIDKTIYTDWNALTSKAFIKASSVLNQKSYLEVALKNIEFIFSKCFKRFVLHYPDSEVIMLRDHIALLSVLLDAYEATKDNKYLKKSEEIVELLFKNFYDKTNGAFFSTLRSDIGELSIRKKRFNENCLISMELLRFDKLANQNHSKEIEKTLLFFHSSARNYGFLAVSYTLAVDMFLESKTF